ncbi:hypothetical protein J6590_078830 [Homalodisca vitripennis]|nr:hypothetical protein J6590_078830 [Homalodisca vitripennis]
MGPRPHLLYKRVGAPIHSTPPARPRSGCLTCLVRDNYTIVEIDCERGSEGLCTQTSAGDGYHVKLMLECDKIFHCEHIVVLSLNLFGLFWDSYRFHKPRYIASALVGTWWTVMGPGCLVRTPVVPPLVDAVWGGPTLQPFRPVGAAAPPRAPETRSGGSNTSVDTRDRLEDLIHRFTKVNKGENSMTNCGVWYRRAGAVVTSVRAGVRLKVNLHSLSSAGSQVWVKNCRDSSLVTYWGLVCTDICDSKDVSRARSGGTVLSRAKRAASQTNYLRSFPSLLLPSDIALHSLWKLNKTVRMKIVHVSAGPGS